MCFMQYVSWILLGCSLLHILQAANLPILKPRNGDPFDTIPQSFWHEFSSPFTDPPLEEDFENNEETTTHEPYPFFEDSATTINVTTQLGNHVYLHCRVNDLNEKTVSWVRRKGSEFHLITFGQHIYSSDSRYTLEYQPPNDWQLLIQFANERDEGHYECQVSSHPPLVYIVYLSVVVPRVEIVDERGLSTPDKYYKAGSTIELKCVISKVPQPSSYVTWKHGVRMLNYDTSRGGIRIHTIQKSVKTDLQPGGAISRLYIANANRLDSGNYTCSLADVTQATVLVHVLNVVGIQRRSLINQMPIGGNIIRNCCPLFLDAHKEPLLLLRILMVMEAMVCQLFFTAHDEGHKEWSDFTSVFVGRENPAAMQHGGCARWTPLVGATLLALLPPLFMIQR